MRLESWSRIRTNSRKIRDQLAATNLAKDNFAYWQGSSVIKCKKSMYSTIQYCAWAESVNSSVSAWKEKIDWFQNSLQLWELDRVDGEPMEFEWKNFQGFTTLQILAEIQNMTETKCKPEKFQGRNIFMSTYNDNAWWRKKHRIVYCEFRQCSSICKKIRARSLVVSWARIGNEVIWNSYVQTERRMGQCRWDHDDKLLWKRTSRASRIQYLGKSEIWRANEKEKCLYISMAATKPSKWFFAQSFPSISSVFTEQWRKCVET